MPIVHKSTFVSTEEPTSTTQKDTLMGEQKKKCAKKHKNKTVLAASDCAGNRHVDVSKKPTKSHVHNIWLSVHKILTHYGRGYKVHHAATRQMTTHQLNKKCIQ